MQINNKLLKWIFITVLSALFNFSCSDQISTKTPTKHELISVSDSMVKREIADLNLAANLILDNGQRYTISNYKIAGIYKKNKITFAVLDMNSRAPKDFVYWYDHQKLSEEFGFEIKGLKYQ